ncbi:Mov34/MPN/PAD-1 family protein [Calothrix sp. NIES-4071]|nr:Mov34/MPN/PAD-1 family protein [Calothrix sp. NIES-4071]BAZ55684.1 Mov34/MPN/PAD-1 family protein [Calothrix sp. NIES-4105]
MIQLTDSHLQIIYQNAERAYPEECCGILLGVTSGHEKQCIKVIATENAWNTQETPDLFTHQDYSQETSRNRRYTIAPKDLMQAQKRAREASLNIIGIFHSHTDNLAIPSEFDREYAWQEYSYIIVSVQKGKAADVRSWCLDETDQFQEETIQKIY